MNDLASRRWRATGFVVRGRKGAGDAGSKSFGYDAAGRQTSVTVGGQTTTVAYDYEGRITQISYPGGSTNTFTYNGLDTRVGKVDSSGTKTFKRDGVDVTSPLLSDGAANYTPGVSERRSGVSKFTHADRMGTTQALTNGSQSVTDTRGYDAFGMLLSSTGSTPTPFGYAGGVGYQEDGDSGLKLLGHRYYDASTGRFLTRDPAKDGRNWYVYCGNNPLAGVDPEGYEDDRNPTLTTIALVWGLKGFGDWLGGRLGPRHNRPGPGVGITDPKFYGDKPRRFPPGSRVGPLKRGDFVAESTDGTPYHWEPDPNDKDWGYIIVDPKPPSPPKQGGKNNGSGTDKGKK